MQLPALGVLRSLVRHYAEVLRVLDLKRTEQPLVLPNNHWFPDAFLGDQTSFERLVARMQGYAGLEDKEIEARLLGATDAAGCKPQGCGTGSCGTGSTSTPTEGPRLLRSGGAWLLEMPAAAVNQPIALTANVARSLGQVRLAEAGLDNDDPGVAELAATALGFGVLLLEGSHLYSKSCGGPSVGRATALGCEELALPFALFVAIERHRVRAALGELSTTQRAVTDEAWVLVQSNAALVELLAHSPARVARGEFQLGEARSWLARVLGLGGSGASKVADPEQAALRALERGDDVEDIAALLGSKGAQTATASKRAAQDDVSQLVDEALAELHAPEANATRSTAAE
ncbi:MAG TPA: hypothetical protein VER33_22480 [Polyangiaceae bacterium]|nr:hypothetical protein [Polyangiaceae bacterium]